MKSSNRKFSKNFGGKRRNGPKRISSQPPALNTNVMIAHTYRFRSTSDTTTSITQDNLIGMCGAMCYVTDTALAPLANSVRVKSISIWSPPASQGAVATCSVNWSTETFASSIERSDTTISTSQPAKLRTKPPIGSAAWLWLSTGTDVIFKIVAPTGSIIDVHCVHVLNDTQTIGTTYLVASGTLGVLYYPPLDGTGDKYLPVSLGTTT